MKIALEMDHSKHVEMFWALSEMVRGLVQLVELGDSMAVDELDERMKAGAVVRMTFSVGSAGPLGMVFQGIRPDGSAFDLLTIDAPPSLTAFRFKDGHAADHARAACYESQGRR